MLIELTFTQSALVCCVFERERENDSEEVRTSDFFFFFFFDEVCSDVGQGQLFYTSAGGFAAHAAVMWNVIGSMRSDSRLHQWSGPREIDRRRLLQSDHAIRIRLLRSCE